MRIGLDKLPARLDFITHKGGKGFVGLNDIFQFDFNGKF